MTLLIFKPFMNPGKYRRRLLGATALAAAALLAGVSYAGAMRLEQGVQGSSDTARPAGLMSAATESRPFRSSLPDEGRAPVLGGAADWLNSKPLSLESLRGKVVLVNFWTYSCINSIRAIPYTRAWAEKYAADGLVVLGVHAPEFSFEKDTDNVEKALAAFDVRYPVALDNDYRLWNAFENNYWPAFYLIDAEGHVRYHHFGEGNYRRTEQAIQDLLREAGSHTVPDTIATPEAHGTEVAADFDEIRSDETYLGYRRTSGFASPQGLQGDAAATYTLPTLRLNQWGLSGTWLAGAEAITAGPAGGSIAYRFSARDLHLVLGPGIGAGPVHFRVTLDGKAPGENHGTDTDAEGYGTITGTRLYQLVRQSGPVGAHTFEIRFTDPGAKAFAFTFG